MTRLARTLVCALAALLAVAPLSAAVYTVTLKSGATFETRYQPEDAAWDSNKISFLDEMGNQVSVSKDEVEGIESDFEAKGYGMMIDNTTMALGWAPNDGIDPASEEGQAAAAAAAAAASQPQMPNITYDQFVEPDQLQGMPATWVGLSGYSAPMSPTPVQPGEAPPPPPSGDQGY